MDCSVLLLCARRSAGSACIAHNNCTSCPSIRATLSALLINISVLSSCFCIGSALSLRWNNPVQRCLPVGGRLHYPRRRRWWLHALTDRLLMCNRRRPAATSSRRASFSALASSCSPRVFCIERSNITLTHLHVSRLPRSPASVLWHFVALGFVGNGVITVMINSPWQADDDGDNQRDNRGDSAHTSISEAPPALNFAIRLSPYARTDHNQRPAVKPRYCCNGRLPDGYHHDQS